MPPEGKHPDFIVRQDHPLNGGSPLGDLAAAQRTPAERFFVRSHGDIPQADAETWRLRISGLVRSPQELSLQDLSSNFRRHAVVAALECAGNRRNELIAVAPTPGELEWHAEAIGNAGWSGWSLAEVLAAARPLPEARHVEFLGIDETERHGRRFTFGGSIPIEKALAREVLLADTMNGEELPPAHGFPLRAVVPGYLGARSVKWLAEIRLREEPSENYFQAHAYRLFPPWVNPTNVVWESGLMLGEMPVTSVISTPAPSTVLSAGEVEVGGYAYVGGGRRIERVDLSIDGGRTWRAADLGVEEGPWSWRLFSARIALPPGEHELVVRAFDRSAQTQPRDAAEVWNFKGYANNAWHRVRVSVR
ncbi:MAG TPA: sulfite oxidase [Thermoanaerobaculia bacterium]|jgi:sulfite oxidase|nr:sulfite oxidase [Thermoanaerobaculia bacterium]